MVERRTLEDVLADLKEAEKEYKEKCLKYGIEEKHKRKKAEDEENVEIVDSEKLEQENSNQESIEPQTINEEVNEN